MAVVTSCENASCVLNVLVENMSNNRAFHINVRSYTRSRNDIANPLPIENGATGRQLSLV